ncbi:MAG TPA: efflux transporter outer membrane subunit [Candidatus Acidoferrum sp.]|nr:efflux transporter outer membrane subunit [Candidatus Acidoferrum sp.]
MKPRITERQSLLAALLTAGLLAGCMVGPNYHRPAVQPPTAFRDLSDNPQAQAQVASYADLPWWQVFQDPQLQELMRVALKQNYDLLIATERINASRAQLAITKSNLFPQVSGNGNFTGGKEYNFQTKYNFLTTTADAAFQLDFFGKLRRADEAARAQLLGTEDAKQTVILTLVSDVASDYFTLLQLDLELQITKDTVSTQQDSVKLTNLRLDHGVATKLDVLQAQQVLDTANAQIPDLERQIAQEENAINILLGNYPQGVTRGRPLVEQNLPPEVPPGLPSSLIERRPDIREAEQDLIASNAEIGVAKAQFFPQISLTGSGGGAFGRSSAFTGLMSSQLGIWSYGAQVSQPIFTGGALRGNLKLAKSQFEQALLAYRQTIQKAFGDASDALIGYQKFHQVRLRQEDSVADLRESVRLSNLRYTGGTTTYLEVLDGQRSLFTAELTLAQARGDEYQSLVQLYRALGGGWQQ